MRKRFLFVFLIVTVLIALLFLVRKQFFVKENNQAEIQKEYTQRESTLVIPIDIDLTSFETMFNQQFEEQGYFYKEEDIEVKKNISLSFQIKKNGLAQLYPENEKIKLVLPMLIEIYPKAKGLLSVGLSKDTQLLAKVTLYADIEGGLNEDWSLNTTTQSKFTIEETPQLSVLGFNIDFGKQLKSALTVGIDEINESINTQLQDVLNTKEIVNFVWEELKEPYKVNEDPFDTWANIDVKKVYANQLKPAGPGVLNMTMKVDALFDIKAGSKPNVSQRRLPNATFVDDDFGKKSTLNVPLIIDKQVVVDYLNKEYSPTSFQVQGKELLIGDFKVYPSENQFKMDANFSYRGLDGTINITARPKFDEASQTISLTNLQLNSKSNKKVVDGIVNLVQKNPQLKQKLEEQLKYSLQKNLADITFDITKQLKGTEFNEYSKLDGYLDYIKIKDVYVEKDSFLLDTEIKAAAVVKVGAN